MKTETVIPGSLIVLAIVVSAYTVVIASQRPLTNLEGALLQAFALLAGIIGSFIFGRQSARDAAKQMIKPHARSAFRRLISLYQSLSRVAIEIGDARNSEGNGNKEVALARLEAIVIEQLATANDALEDWNDIVPEDVQEIRKRITANIEEVGQ